MEELYNLSFALAAAAMFICLANICFISVQDRMGKTQNRLFVLLLITVAVNGASNTISAFFSPYRQVSENAVLYSEIARYFYFVFHTALAPLFFFYVSHVCGAVFRSSQKKRYIIYFVVFAITETMAIINPLTKWVYYIDADLQFRRNWGEMLIYLAAAFYLAMSLRYLTSSWSSLTVKRRTGILMFASFSIAGIIIQLIFSKVKVELFAEAIGLTGVMMIVENEDDRLDSETGLYNRKAFIMDLGSYIIHQVHLHALCLRINTPEIITRKRGADSMELVEKKVSEFLETVHEKYNIYRIGRRTFVLLVFEGKNSNVSGLAEKINERFKKPWQLVDNFVLLSSSIIIADIPEQVKSLNEALYMFDYAKTSGENKSIIAGDDLELILRDSAVEKSIAHGLAEGLFEVYYQPIYLNDGKTLYGAEALVRLHDDKMGMLFPDEFIPVAESIGLIDAVDDHVLLDVCRTINEEKLYDNKIGVISINLSVLQFMKPGFVERINGMVEESGVDKKLISFEVTESVSASSYELMNDAINELKQDGFRFAMDDYGTGYSNMKALAAMNLDCIKIDKSILWEAEKSEIGKILLENNIRMIHQLKKKILVEGVETKAQIDLLQSLGVDYLQGFYFSKPVPKAEFLKMLV
ncbi:MAG: GGDEF domain-containing protein [Clostridiales bacterium]|nr:GGDEF domain-containing protein [Clostridiales bacterium]